MLCANVVKNQNSLTLKLKNQAQTAYKLSPDRYRAPQYSIARELLLKGKTQYS
jgi:hypothetical protein